LGAEPLYFVTVVSQCYSQPLARRSRATKLAIVRVHLSLPEDPALRSLYLRATMSQDSSLQETGTGSATGKARTGICRCQRYTLYLRSLSQRSRFQPTVAMIKHFV